MNKNLWRWRCFRNSPRIFTVLTTNVSDGQVRLWRVDNGGSVLEIGPNISFPDLRQFYPCVREMVPPAARALIRAACEEGFKG